LSWSLWQAGRSQALEKRPSKNLYLRQRAFFVDLHEAARARDIRRQSPLYVLAAQDAVASTGSVN
jgi:hypothetical protein